MRSPTEPVLFRGAFTEIQAIASDAIGADGARLAALPPSALTLSYGYRCRVAPVNGNGIGQFSEWSQPVQWCVRPPATPSLATAIQLSRESNSARYVTVVGDLRSGVNGEAVAASDATLSVRYSPAADAAGAVGMGTFNRSSAADGCRGSREQGVTGTANGLIMWQPNASSAGVPSCWRFSFKVLICEQAPYVFAVSATNIGGAASNWSEWSAPVPTNCSAGTFLGADGLQCLSCPDGAACVAASSGQTASALAAQPNWWRAPWVLDASTAFAPCALVTSDGETACLGDNTCVDGYGGVLCHECLAGFARTGVAGCTPCLEPWRSWLALLGVSVLSVLLLAFLVRAALRSRGEPSRLEIVMLKVLMSHLQTVALAAEFDLRWPSWLAGLFAASDASSSLSDAVLSLDCVVPPAAPGSGAAVFAGAALTLCVPFICAALAALFWAAPRGTCGCSARRGSDAADPVDKTAVELVVSRTVAFSVTLIVLLSTMHASLSKAALRLLTCRPLGGRHWLAADLSVECWAANSPHARYGVPLGSLALILFAVGIPAGTAFVLFQRRRELTRPAMRVRIGFLYASYRNETFFWDSVVLLRKLAIAAVAVFLRPAGAGLQAFTANMVTLFSLSLHMQVQPYANAGVNALDSNALRAQLATFSLSILLYLSDTADGLKMSASVGILIANVAYLAYFALVFFRGSPLLQAAAGRLSAGLGSIRVRVGISAAAFSFPDRRSRSRSDALEAEGGVPLAAVELAVVAPRHATAVSTSAPGVALVTNPLARFGSVSLSSVVSPRTSESFCGSSGWIQALDSASGCPFWYDSSGRTTWEPPVSSSSSGVR